MGAAELSSCAQTYIVVHSVAVFCCALSVADVFAREIPPVLVKFRLLVGAYTVSQLIRLGTSDSYASLTLLHGVLLMIDLLVGLPAVCYFVEYFVETVCALEFARRPERLLRLWRCLRMFLALYALACTVAFLITPVRGAFLARAVMGLLIVLVLYFPGITIMGNVVWKLRAHRKTIARHPFAAAGSAAGQDASPVDNTLATTTDADENADRTTRETRGKDKTRDRDADRLWRAEVNLWMFVVAKFLFALSWVYFSASNLILYSKDPGAPWESTRCEFRPGDFSGSAIVVISLYAMRAPAAPRRENCCAASSPYKNASTTHKDNTCTSGAVCENSTPIKCDIDATAFAFSSTGSSSPPPPAYSSPDNTLSTETFSTMPTIGNGADKAKEKSLDLERTPTCAVKAGPLRKPSFSATSVESCV